jgi:hypothetical protein
MLHTLRFSLQNVVYFIMLPSLVHVLFKFYVQDVLKFKCKTSVPKSLICLEVKCMQMDKPLCQFRSQILVLLAVLFIAAIGCRIIQCRR